MINNILNFLIGLTLFIFGMNNLTNSLKKSNKDKIKNIIEKTNNKYKGVIVGTIITALIQSSSFVTILLVGLVDSGIMTLNSTIGIIMGSNIGTCITSWIISLSSINKDILSFLSLDNLIGIFAIISLLFLINKRHNKANIIFGIIILILGMNIMTESMSPLSNSKLFQEALNYLSNPILGLFLGIILTAIFQSSSLIIGILEGLSITSNISSRLLFGSNILISMFYLPFFIWLYIIP